jgi:hypothetical protein
MAKEHRDTVAAYCIEQLKKTGKFIPLVICYWQYEDRVIFDLADFPYSLDGSDKSEDFYTALGCVGARMGEVVRNFGELTRLYMALESVHTMNGKPVLILAELDIADGTQIQRGYDISPDAQKSLSAATFFEECTIISPRLALIAAGYFGIKGTLEQNKSKILPFIGASMKFLP